MIQKITKIICDNCGAGIYDVTGNPPRAHITSVKQNNWVVKYTDGGRKDFCDEKCYQEWRNKCQK